MAGKRAFGSVIGTYASATLTPIGQPTKITPFGKKADSADVTSHDSPTDGNGNPWREKIVTLLDAGSAKFDVNFDPANASHVALEASIGVMQVWKVKMPPSSPPVVWTFNGFLSEDGLELPHDNKTTGSFVVTISGIPTVGAT